SFVSINIDGRDCCQTGQFSQDVADRALTAIVGFAGMIITWIVKSFDEDVDYYVPVAEIEKLENQHFDEITKAGLKNGN
ncbi:hypothetical protein MJ731_003949, partial [Shigella flexneri]|nr:hypothetical protein [Shigella flexneri]